LKKKIAQIKSGEDNSWVACVQDVSKTVYDVWGVYEDYKKGMDKEKFIEDIQKLILDGNKLLADCQSEFKVANFNTYPACVQDIVKIGYDVYGVWNEYQSGTLDKDTFIADLIKIASDGSKLVMDCKDLI